MTSSIISLIDHAVLHPTQTEADVCAACNFCAAMGVASVCVKPSFVPVAARCLADYRRTSEHGGRLSTWWGYHAE